MTKISKTTIILILVCMIIGYMIGNITAEAKAIQFCVDAGLYFLDVQGANVTIDENMIEHAITSYRLYLGEFG